MTTPHKPDDFDTNDFNRRLKSMRDRRESDKSKRNASQPESSETQKATGTAMRIGVEMVAGIIVGVGIGLLIDHYFDTSPFGLIVMFLLGVCAGFMNVYRAMNNMGYTVGYSQKNEDNDNSSKDHK